MIGDEVRNPAAPNWPTIYPLSPLKGWEREKVTERKRKRERKTKKHLHRELERDQETETESNREIELNIETIFIGEVRTFSLSFKQFNYCGPAAIEFDVISSIFDILLKMMD